MMKKLYDKLRTMFFKVNIRLSYVITKISFYLNGVKWTTFSSVGVPLIDIKANGQCVLGEHFCMVNKARYSTLGKNNRCKILVYEHAKLLIGKKVAMSNATIVVTLSVTLSNNIMIGGGVTIVDSDFHSFNPTHWHSEADALNMQSAPVVIMDNVFIGMDSIILKGVTVGSNVIIAAGSVVSKDIPDNQVWGGNPAKFIRYNENLNS